MVFHSRRLEGFHPLSKGRLVYYFLVRGDAGRRLEAAVMAAVCFCGQRASGRAQKSAQLVYYIEWW